MKWMLIVLTASLLQACSGSTGATSRTWSVVSATNAFVNELIATNGQILKTPCNLITKEGGVLEFCSNEAHQTNALGPFGSLTLFDSGRTNAGSVQLRLNKGVVLFGLSPSSANYAMVTDGKRIFGNTGGDTLGVGFFDFGKGAGVLSGLCVVADGLNVEWVSSGEYWNFNSKKIEPLSTAGTNIFGFRKLTRGLKGP